MSCGAAGVLAAGMHRGAAAALTGGHRCHLCPAASVPGCQHQYIQRCKSIVLSTRSWRCKTFWVPLYWPPWALVDPNSRSTTSMRRHRVLLQQMLQAGAARRTQARADATNLDRWGIGSNRIAIGNALGASSGPQTAAATWMRNPPFSSPTSRTRGQHQSPTCLETSLGPSS